MTRIFPNTRYKCFFPKQSLMSNTTENLVFVLLFCIHLVVVLVTNQIVSSDLRYILFWKCPYKQVYLELDSITHVRSPQQYEDNYFKANSKLMSIIAMYSFANINYYFASLTRTECIIESYSNNEFLKFFESCWFFESKHCHHRNSPILCHHHSIRIGAL